MKQESMFNTKKHKVIISIFVGFLVIGLIGAYVPLLFVSDTPVVPRVSTESNLPTPQELGAPAPKPGERQVVVPVVPKKDVVATTTKAQSPQSANALEGFSGLSEEGKSLEGLDALLSP